MHVLMYVYQVIGSKYWFQILVQVCVYVIILCDVLLVVLLHKTNISNQSVSTERKGEVVSPPREILMSCLLPITCLPFLHTCCSSPCPSSLLRSYWRTRGPPLPMLIPCWPWTPRLSYRYSSGLGSWRYRVTSTWRPLTSTTTYHSGSHYSKHLRGKMASRSSGTCTLKYVRSSQLNHSPNILTLLLDYGYVGRESSAQESE